MPTLPLSSSRSAGDFLFLSGQIAVGPGGGIVGDGVVEQTHEVVDRIEALLTAAGLTLADVVKTTIWLTDSKDFAAFNQAYASRFAEPYPVRSTVVSELVLPGALVEIEAVASRGNRS
ncbi:MAG TPA: RidA family protein [Allosphingosinicella sp.]